MIQTNQIRKCVIPFFYVGTSIFTDKQERKRSQQKKVQKKEEDENQEEEEKTTNTEKNGEKCAEEFG